ncbi:TetR/AcrR family transcriptional regulator [Novosphingobium album (ex Liu et al. 2023)]|uniref:TetR/AcrR family transcriptional regulator n=1 Tax=Novosphingobium album (ex Liu et al. 2023) TaxID=3031130 RepID=A0ABT5WUE6_9SPHN|nr:TetR/AcrR family transcriptional regulator [Novosphingobium album (ex Liu et al. 2023)]MDE8653482.1 TetR/AcrR family transcriptional regulator [Novosphingobium album (ex Liu et al. 2023)]
MRDPVATRETILEAASNLLAKDGPEGISLSAVAHLASVNRGTAYQHFETRERLIEATVQWVSDKLFRAVFGDPATLGERRVEEADVSGLTERLCDFAMENPDLCRVWLQQVLASPDPRQDPFWREYAGSFGRFAKTDMAEPDIDVEVLSVVNLAGVFFWPILARAHAADPRRRKELARRFSREILRLSLFGTMRAEAFPAIVGRVRGENPGAGPAADR